MNFCDRNRRIWGRTPFSNAICENMMSARSKGYYFKILLFLFFQMKIEICMLTFPVHTQNKNKEAKGNNKKQRRRRQWPPYNLF